MKKLVKLLLVGLMSLTCVACGNNNDKEDQVWSDQLIKEGELVVGISPDYPPYETIDENGNMVGFDIDMAEELAEIQKNSIMYTMATRRMSNIITEMKTVINVGK